MRIKSVKVDRYGPLSGFHERSLSNFVLVYGPNEEGKTLLLDSIIKLLYKKELGRQAKNFGNIQRVTEEPDGYLVLEHSGREVKLEGTDTLTKHVDISPTDFRNIFVVRDSDLSLVSEGEYFGQVSEQLAGLRTSEISTIRKAIQIRGRLTNATSKGELSDSAATGHIGTKIKSATRFMREIGEAIPLYQNSNFDGLERELVEMKERQERVEQEIKTMRRAEVRERFEKSYSYLREYKGTLNALRELDVISESEWEKWRELDLERRQHEGELKEARAQHSRYRQRLEVVNKDYPAARARVDELAQKRAKVDHVLAPKVQSYDEFARVQSGREAFERLWKWGTGVSALLLLLSVAGAVLRPGLFFFAAAGASALLGIVFVTQLFRILKAKAHVSSALDDLVSSAKKFDVPVDITDGSFIAGNPLEKEQEEAAQALRECEIARRALASNMFNVSQAITKHANRVTELDDKVAMLTTQSGMASRGEYQKALRKKRDLANRRQSLEELLSEAISPMGKKNPVQVWETEIRRHLDAPGAPTTGISWDPVRVQGLEQEIRELKVKVDEQSRAYSLGRTQLRDLEMGITQSGIMSDTFACRTVKDLQSLSDSLGRFIQNVENDVENARTAIRIFEEIEEEEKARVVELFGPTQQVSAFFKQMTGGRYVEVIFDVAAGTIIARLDDGSMIPAEYLSGGAFDQLYLSVRLSMGGSILRDNAGFFLLDDAFIKSDFGRLKNQVETLKAVTLMGWQVIYFSSKKEILEVLEEDIEENRVQLIQIKDAPLPTENKKPNVDVAAVARMREEVRISAENKVGGTAPRVEEQEPNDDMMAAVAKLREEVRIAAEKKEREAAGLSDDDIESPELELAIPGPKAGSSGPIATPETQDDDDDDMDTGAQLEIPRLIVDSAGDEAPEGEMEVANIVVDSEDVDTTIERGPVLVAGSDDSKASAEEEDDENAEELSLFDAAPDPPIS